MVPTGFSQPCSTFFASCTTPKPFPTALQPSQPPVYERLVFQAEFGTDFARFLPVPLTSSL